MIRRNKRKEHERNRWDVESYLSLSSSLRRIVSLLGNPSHNNRPRARRSTHRSPWPIPFGHGLGRGTHNLGRGRCRRRLLTGHRRRAMSMPCPGPPSTRPLLCCSLCLNWVVCEIRVLLIQYGGKRSRRAVFDLKLSSVESMSLLGCEHRYGPYLHTSSLHTYRSTCSSAFNE